LQESISPPLQGILYFSKSLLTQSNLSSKPYPLGASKVSIISIFASNPGYASFEQLPLLV